VLRLADDDPHAGDASSSDSAGRRALLARTKVLVCLHRDDKPYFEWSRAIDAIHAGAVVVSEHSSGLAPLEPGKHLLVGSPDSLPFLVDALLRDDDQLARLRVQAHERLSAWLPAALHVAVLRAAIVELVGEPVPPGTYMGQPARRDGRDRARSREPDGAEAGTDRAIRRALDDVRRDLAAVRRHVARVEETMQTASGAPPIRVAHESPAWAARRGAKVSVLVAFNEGGDPLVRTLGSVAESSLRDLEIVVVARGANRADEQSASQWLDRRPHLASRLVVQHVDHGVGAARNVASDFARSPYWLIVDPGQELLPRCLAVLADALDTAPDVAFAYPMQQAIAPGADDQDLVNYVGWDRERLREEDYIHAPALIRADRVRQVGRFGEGPSFEGKVDHDLWCRLADQGWKGLGVPQILARRREDPSGRV
jgi:hypothetical protein